MKAVLQRVSRAEVRVEGRVRGRIDRGLLVLLGVAAGDSREQAARLAEKTAKLRVFPGGDGRPMDKSVLEAENASAVLVVSQFTLLADTRKGRRPDFTAAARPELAKELYEAYLAELAARGLRVEQGEFGAMMDVELVNDGPVTILLEE